MIFIKLRVVKISRSEFFKIAKLVFLWNALMNYDFTRHNNVLKHKLCLKQTFRLVKRWKCVLSWKRRSLRGKRKSKKKNSENWLKKHEKQGRESKMFQVRVPWSCSISISEDYGVVRLVLSEVVNILNK